MSDAWNICRCCGKTFIYCAVNWSFMSEEDQELLRRRGYPPRFCSKECQELSENEKYWQEPRTEKMREYEWC